MKKKIIFLILLLVLILPLGIFLQKNWDSYFVEFDPGEFERAYDISQYMVEKGAAWMPDEAIFSYASWYYLKGGSPILVNPENPPLGKYIVGLSIKYFNKAKAPSLLFGGLSIYSFFLISRLLFKNKSFALFPVILFSWEKIFKEQLVYMPLFEIYGLAFLNFSIYFFIKGFAKPINFLFSSIFLGALWATKPWMLTIPLVASWLFLFLLFLDFKKLMIWSSSLIAAFLVVILSYGKLLFCGWSIVGVLGVQKWIAWYHRSKILMIGSVWPFIYLRRWYVWWGDEPFVKVDQWNILWPIFATIAIITSASYLAKKSFRQRKNMPELIIALWILIDLAFLSFGTINVRYFFYLLPHLYLMGFYFLIKVLPKYIKRNAVLDS